MQFLLDNIKKGGFFYFDKFNFFINDQNNVKQCNTIDLAGVFANLPSDILLDSYCKLIIKVNDQIKLPFNYNKLLDFINTSKITALVSAAQEIIIYEQIAKTFNKALDLSHNCRFPLYGSKELFELAKFCAFEEDPDWEFCYELIPLIEKIPSVSYKALEEMHHTFNTAMILGDNISDYI